MEVIPPKLPLSEKNHSASRNSTTLTKQKIPPPPEEAAIRQGISFRAILLGMLGVVAVCYLVSYAELMVAKMQIGILQFPPVVIGGFLLLVWLNRGLRRIADRLTLNPQELMTIYCMVLIGTMVSSRGVMERIVPTLVGIKYLANTSNRWAELFFPYIKNWMVAFDPNGPEKQSVVTLFYEGTKHGEKIPWAAWITPMLVWGAVVGLSFFGFICLASILRKQWADNEKLTFPLVQLPLEMAKETPVFRNRLIIIGFAIPAFIFGLNGFHALWPTVPMINVVKPLSNYLTVPPWNAISTTNVYLSFAAIGFFYFLPSDLLFSLWFFFLLTRVEAVIAAAYGIVPDAMPSFPTQRYIAYQMAGAYFVLAGYYIFIGWPHIKKVIQAAFHGAKGEDEGELLPYWVAFWGIPISILGVAVWCWMMGMSLWIAVIQMAIFMLIVAVIMTRSTAEAGLLMTETAFKPIDIIRLFTPISNLGVANLTVTGFLDPVFFRDQRGLILTAFMDGLKISDGVTMRRRNLLMIFGSALVVAYLAAAYIQISLAYHRGAMTMYNYLTMENPTLSFSAATPAMNGPVPWEPSSIAFMGVGALVTVFLTFMRLNFFWWPLHPLGYALSSSWSMFVFWFPCMVAWMAKGVITRYGGMRFYMKARPFFFGLILGEFTLALIWTIVSWKFNCSAPEFPWP